MTAHDVSMDRSMTVIDRAFYVAVACQPEIVMKRFLFWSLKESSPDLGWN